MQNNKIALITLFMVFKAFRLAIVNKKCQNWKAQEQVLHRQPVFQN